MIAREPFPAAIDTMDFATGERAVQSEGFIPFAGIRRFLAEFYADSARRVAIAKFKAACAAEDIAVESVELFRVSEGAELAECGWCTEVGHGTADCPRLAQFHADVEAMPVPDDAPDGITRCRFCGHDTTALVKGACGACR